MDKRSFARVASKKHSAGYYVNIIFTGQPSMVAQLRSRFALNEEQIMIKTSAREFLEKECPKALVRQMMTDTTARFRV
jgi:ribosomal protein S6